MATGSAADTQDTLFFILFILLKQSMHWGAREKQQLN
jgi:hypothetical protein